MTEEEEAAKLKARLDRWKVYVEHPQIATNHPSAASQAGGEVPYVNGADTRNGSAPDKPSVSAEPMPPMASARFEAADVEVIPVQKVIERYEEQIADLQSKVEREREQARQIAATLAREQALQAFKLQAQHPPQADGRTSLASNRRHQTHPRRRPGERNGLLFLGTVLFLIGGMGILLLYLYLR